MLNASFVIPATHLSLAGHFPGNPIAPGVVTLDHVVNGLIAQLQDARLDALPQVKFKRPLLPDVEVTVTYKAKTETLYLFSCASAESVIVTGQIRLVIGEA